MHVKDPVMESQEKHHEAKEEASREAFGKHQGSDLRGRRGSQCEIRSQEHGKVGTGREVGTEGGEGFSSATVGMKDGSSREQEFAMWTHPGAAGMSGCRRECQ
jgi:hypothetical protein